MKHSGKRDRRLRPSLGWLEGRTLPAAVVLADIDTGALPMVSWADANLTGMPDSIPLGNYLAPGWDFRAPGAPTSEVNLDTEGPGGHGSLMAAQYALAMVAAGRSATVVPLIAGSSAGFDPAAVGRAMSWVAAQALANPSVQWIVAAPIEGGIASIEEIQGLDQLAAAGVPISLAAGNDSLDLDSFPIGMTGIHTTDMLVAAAADPAGNLQSYSNYGPKTVTVAAAIGNSGLGTSGATEVAAAWLAMAAGDHPLAPGQSRSSYGPSLVSSVAAVAIPTGGTTGLTAHGWLPGIPQSVPMVTEPGPTSPVVSHPSLGSRSLHHPRIKVLRQADSRPSAASEFPECRNRRPLR